MNKLFKFYMTALLVIFFSFAANITFAEDATPSGTVTIETTAVAIGVGFNWGDGVLYFQGKEYPFKVKGVSIVDIGIAKVSAVGDVYHLNTVDDFPGTFSAAEAGIAIGAGVGGQIMENQKKVVLKLTSKKAGIQLKLAPEGLEIKLK
jgi:outer membrane immunogenic protein